MNNRTTFAESKINEKAGTAPGETCGGIFATTEITDCGDNVVSNYDSYIKKDDIKAKLMNIKDFLYKPYLVSVVPWSTGSIKNDVIGNWNISSLLLGNSIWKNKIEGFNLFRGTAVVRLLLNANPFQQGKLLLHFLPNRDAFTSSDLSYVATHNACIAAKRQQPCVEIDCADGGAVFKIPYLSPTSWLNLSTGVYDWGQFYISVMSPLAVGTGGVVNVDVSVYLHFEDVELGAPMVPQTLGGGVGGPKKKFAARSVGKDLASKELNAMGEGSVSSALKAGSVAASKLGEISAMANLASPATWTLMAAAGLSNYLGWSKPTNNKAEMLVSQQFERYGATSDGVSNAFPLALRSDNALSVSDGYSIYEEDEMSFAFLYRVATCTNTYTWPASGMGSTSGSSIISAKAIRPLACVETGAKSGTTNVISWAVGPPMAYLSNYFKFWRGSIDMTIKLVKTDYHTGRLQLTWTPVNNTSYNQPDLVTGQYALREIIDIKEGNEFSFNLPWMLEQNYIDNTDRSGYLDIIILNELRAPDTCAQAIELLIYFKGGPDFELQVPGKTLSTINGMPFSPQTLSENTGDKVIVSGPVGGTDMKRHNVDFAAMSTGEIPMGIKQFLARNNSVVFKTAMPGSGLGFSVWPWYTGIMYATAVTAVPNGPEVAPDAMAIFSTMYAYYRGSANITVRTSPIDTGGSGRNEPLRMMVKPFQGNRTPYDVPTYLGGVPETYNYVQSAYNQIGLYGVAISNAGIGQTSFKIPYQARTKCSLICKNTTSNTITSDFSRPIIIANVEGQGAFVYWDAYRSFGDDFQFSYFLGAPPFITNLA